MPQNAWSAKRKRHYMPIKDSLLERGKPESLAQEIAARVVNKERTPPVLVAGCCTWRALPARTRRSPQL